MLISLDVSLQLNHFWPRLAKVHAFPLPLAISLRLAHFLGKDRQGWVPDILRQDSFLSFLVTILLRMGRFLPQGRQC